MKRIAWFIGSLIGFMLISGSALAITYTFDEYSVGTIITNQYSYFTLLSGTDGNTGRIALDSDFPSAPVLSPSTTSGWTGDYTLDFVVPVYGLSFDTGYWNTPGAGVIDVFASDDTTLVAQLSNVGTVIEAFDLSSYGNIGKLYFSSLSDPAGSSIDNLSFTPVPEPSTFLLLGGGLAGLAFVVRRRKKE